MASYQQKLDEFEQLSVRVVGLSTDGVSDAERVVNDLGLTFPIAYGLDGPLVAQRFGAFYEERRRILHATAFIVGPDREVLSFTYSSGPVGRLVPSDALRWIAFNERKRQSASEP